MLTWSLIFLIVAIVSAIFGYTGIAQTAVGFSKTIFFIAIGLFLISLGINFIK